MQFLLEVPVRSRKVSKMNVPGLVGHSLASSSSLDPEIGVGSLHNWDHPRIVLLVARAAAPVAQCPYHVVGMLLAMAAFAQDLHNKDLLETPHMLETMAHVWMVSCIVQLIVNSHLT